MSQGNQAKSPSQVKAASRKQNVLSPKPAVPGAASQDSGYFGSQDIYDFPASQQTLPDSGPHGNLTPAPSKIASSHLANTELPRKSLQGAKDDQATRVLENTVTKAASPQHAVAAVGDDARDEACDATVPDREPSSPPLQPADQAPPPSDADGHHADSPARSDDGASDEVRSTSDGSSPIRGVVRKNSLNFASLPAREPLTAGKSMGARTSRLSHFDHNRKSYYNRDVGGKSSGNNGRQDASDEDADDMDVDDHIVAQSNDDKVTTALNHNKTYTQRLQDQINMLGKSNPRGSRPSKSIPNIATVQPNSGSLQPAEAPKSPTPKPFEAPKTTPGAFPEDDDDWIDPPPAPMPEEAQSPRPALSKSHSADVMEGIHKSDTVGDVDFGSPMDKRGGQSASPQRAPTTQGPSSAGLGHAKSVSVPGVPALTQQLKDQTHPLAKAVSVSNSSIAASGEPKTPSKSPSRGFRESPLKQVKNKLSSILKSSRDLISSSAAISAEGKTSILSPSTSRLALHAAPSSESAMSKPNHDAHKSNKEVQQVEEDDNKTLPIARRTRASVEREKEEKRIEKETKRLEKAREKEREKARVFSKEQERIAAMERQMTSKKGEEKLPAKETPKPTRTSPRKVQRLPESTTKPVDHDVEMADYPPTTQLPLAPRSAGPSQAARSKEIKRPVKPTRDAQVKAKQVPTVIRVHPGSQHPQYHSTVSSSTGSAPDAPVASTPQSQQQGASKAPLQNKQSTQSLKGASTAGRAKAAELAKKKEQEERDAQRRREAKAEMERKKAAAQEEQRKQDQRRQEADRQKQRDREQAAAHAEAKNAQRQAMIEKAKQTRAPPPAVRAQPNGPPDFSHLSHDKSTGHPARPPSRMEDSSRLVSTVLSNVPKPGAKRTMGPEASEEAQGKRQPSRGGLSYASKDAKRLRTTGDNDEMELDNPPNIKGPPVRPSAGFKKVSFVVKVMMLSLTSRRNCPRNPTFKTRIRTSHL